MSEAACAVDLRPQFRLRPGKDDLLIDWLSTFGQRQRSEAIRQALESYLTGQCAETEDDVGRGEDPELAAVLDTLF